MRRVDALRQRSSTKEPSPDEALAQLVESHALLREEHTLYDAPTSANARASARDRDSLGEDFLDVPLHLKGLSSVVDGHVYTGTPAQIRDAFKAADDIGLSAKRVLDKTTGVWRVTRGKRTIEIRELGVRPGQAPRAESSVTAQDVLREHVPRTLSDHQRQGATVREASRDPVTRTRAYDVDYPDGRRFRISERGDPSAQASTNDSPPTRKQAAANRAAADRAAKIQARRDAQLTRLIRAQTDKPIIIDTAIMGAGQAGTLAHASLPDASGAPPGVNITEIPQVINIAPEGSMFGRHGDLRMGQKAPELKGPTYTRQPGEFTSNHDVPIPAKDYVRSLAMTGYESGMATYRATVTEVQVRPAEGWGNGIAPEVASMPIRFTAGGKTIYTRRMIMAGGLGAPAALGGGNPRLAANEAALRTAGRLVYAQESLTLPGGGDVVVVVGDGATGAWACEAAIKSGAKTVYWVGQPPRPGVKVSAEDRAILESYGLSPTEIEVFAKAFNERNTPTFEHIKTGRIKLRITLADASLDPATNKVKATFGDQSELQVDGIVAATGQVLTLPRGINRTQMEFRMVTVMHQGEIRLVALDAYEPRTGRKLGIRLQGAHMAKATSLVTSSETERFLKALNRQASNSSVPPASRGVIGSIYQTNIDVPLANQNATLEKGEPR